jgi:hypothetical protein
MVFEGDQPEIKPNEQTKKETPKCRIQSPCRPRGDGEPTRSSISSRIHWLQKRDHFKRLAGKAFDFGGIAALQVLDAPSACGFFAQKGFGDDLESSGRRGVVAPFPSNQNFDRRETKGGVNYC